MEWAQDYVRQYPELLWLASSDVHFTSENQSSSSKSISREIFRQQFVEFDRSVLSLRALGWLANGDEKSYLAFISEQQPKERLSREHFRRLHHRFRKLVSSHPTLSEEDVLKTLHVSLVLGDLGKSELARAVFTPYGATAPDHDDFYAEVISILQEHPSLSPSFFSLPSEARQLLRSTAGLAHYGHMAHLEGGLGMFSTLKNSTVIREKDRFALHFDLFSHLCDVSGALGHVSSHSALALTESVFEILEATMEAAVLLFKEGNDERVAYEYLLEKRGAWMGIFPKSAEDRILIRAAAMLRLTTPEEGASIKKAYAELSEEERKSLLIFDIGRSSQMQRTPTYMPAVLVNLSNNRHLGKEKSERLERAFKIGLPFLARVLLFYEKSDLTLNFSPIAKAAKSEQALSLKETSFNIMETGLISLN